MIVAMVNTLLLFLHITFVAAFTSNYLESLSHASGTTTASAVDYLDSLSTSHKSSTASSPVKHTTPIKQPKAMPIFDLQKVAEETPSDHYAKKHPGAGWAGYHHPLFGGYLDHLKKNVP